MRLQFISAMLALAGAAYGQSVQACAVLQTGGTSEIQQALDRCSPGQAVVLAGKRGFTSAPLTIPRGVTLFIDEGVTLSASKDPRDYVLPAESPLAEREKPFLFAYQAAFSGIGGSGAIDGQGVAKKLVSTYESQGFQLTGVTLRNAAGIHAAIYKTIGLSMSGVRIEGPGDGVLLSNAVDAKLTDVSVKVSGHALELKDSILGKTTGTIVHGLRTIGGRGVAFRDKEVAFTCGSIEKDEVTAGKCGEAPKSGPVKYVPPAPVHHSPRVTVHAGESVQKAIDSLPDAGGEVTVEPGTYREVVTIRKSNVQLHGAGADKTTIVFNNGAYTHGGTFNTGTVFVEADDVSIDRMTIANDLGSGKGQGVALHVTGDRAVFRNLRILGAQDTLFAASKYCYGDYGPCVPARQYFADSYIEGNTDFIFGDSQALFERCELHGIAGTVMYTAQSRHTFEQKASGYVFDHCRLTGEAKTISLGRPWRPYATVIFLNTKMDAPMAPAGWTEWPRFGKPSLPTATYAEYESTGPGANPQRRQLPEAEAEFWRKWAWRPAR